MAQRIKSGVVSFPAAEVQTLSAAAYVNDRETELLLKDVLPKWGYSKPRVVRGTIGDAIRSYQGELMPGVLIVDISSAALPLSDLQSLADICPPSVQVVVLGTRDNVGLYRDLLEIGVTDYLVKPVPSDLLYKAVARASGQIAARPVEQRTGKTVAVLGVRGGVGATTTVFNVGWLLSTFYSRHVVLADFNLLNGSLALEMGLEPTSGLADLLTNPDRIDNMFVDRATISSSDRLKALASECDLEGDRAFDFSAVERLTKHLRTQYHFILQDVNRCPAPVSTEILKNSDVRVLVLDPSLAAVRDCARLLKVLGDGEGAAKTLIVLNRTRPRTGGEVPLAKIENFIGVPVDMIVPFDKKKMSAASLNAEPVACQKSAVTDAFMRLAGELVGQKQPKPSGRWFSAKRVRS